MGQFFMTQILKCQIMLKFKNMNEKKTKKKVQVVVISRSETKREVLLLEFNSNKNRGPIGFQNITGSVEEGEVFKEAALREIAEEISIDLILEKAEIFDIQFDHSFQDRWDNEKTVIEKTFLCLLNQKPSITLSDEHQGYKWLIANQVLESDYTFPSNFMALKKALEFLEVSYRK